MSPITCGHGVYVAGASKSPAVATRGGRGRRAQLRPPLRLTKAVARDSASPVDPAAMHTVAEGQTSLESQADEIQLGAGSLRRTESAGHDREHRCLPVPALGRLRPRWLRGLSAVRLESGEPV